jgi:hypothetical protein
MASDDNEFADLGRSLQRGTLGHLEPEELDAILGWVAGSQRRAAAELRVLLGSPDADPHLLRRVYQQLDRVLFRNGSLFEEAAAVSGRVPRPQRRARYRRLMAAFHPDRSQGFADWLTPRSQAILHSYAAFRRGEAIPDEAPPEPAKPAPPVRPRRRIFPRVHFGPGLLPALRARLRGVHHLEAKILAIVAVAVFLPVLVLYLNEYPVPPGYDVAADWPPAPEGGSSLTEADPAPQSQAGLSPLSLRSLGASPSPLFVAGLPIDPGPAPQPLLVHAAPDAWATAFETLAHKAEAERVAARDELARSLAAQEIAAIEAAAEQESLRRRVAREAAAREAAAREAAVREAALREAAGREATAREAAAREAAVREAAAREATARESAAREAAVRETAAREAAAREVAAREATARATAAREASTLGVAGSSAAPSSMTQLRVAALIDSYRSAFEKGDLVAFMGHFGPEPRENTNRGRAWFEKNYEDLFAQSGQRKFALDIASITPTGDGDWKVSAAFDLRVDYRGRPAVHASGSVNYRVQQQPEGWRIDSIEYGN